MREGPRRLRLGGRAQDGQHPARWSFPARGLSVTGPAETVVIAMAALNNSAVLFANALSQQVLAAMEAPFVE